VQAVEILPAPLRAARDSITVRRAGLPPGDNEAAERAYLMVGSSGEGEMGREGKDHQFDRIVV
jgi:hypothetical protein